MKKCSLWKITVSVVFGMLYDLAYYIKINLRAIALTMALATPHAMYVIGQLVFKIHNKFSAGLELLIPLVVFLLVKYINGVADRIGQGTQIPMPQKRFTKIDSDGEVTVEKERLQEMLLYVADVEEWLKRKGMM